ncbi:MAG: FadR family transcriptional regulator [Acidaminococcaceae bacterium]|nr:FadR family transcriptional regulator [Acidaminococcaceae bacterium]
MKSGTPYGFKAIEAHNPTVPEQVMESMHSAVRSGAIKVGDVLPPERQLAVELGVSRTSIRECLSIMKFLGIIEVRNNRRVLVKSADSFKEIHGFVRTIRQK